MAAALPGRGGGIGGRERVTRGADAVAPPLALEPFPLLLLSWRGCVCCWADAVAVADDEEKLTAFTRSDGEAEGVVGVVVAGAVSLPALLCTGMSLAFVVLPIGVLSSAFVQVCARFGEGGALLFSLC